MEGHLYQRGKSKVWYLIYDEKREKGEKRSQHCIRLGAMSKRDAEAKKREILTRIDSESWHESESRVTVEQFMDRWLSVRKPNLAAKTYERYKSLNLRHVLPTLGAIQLKKVRPDKVSGIYEQMLHQGLTMQTCLHVHRLLHAAFEYAKRNMRIVQENVIDRVETPKVVKRELIPMTPDQVRLLIDTARGTRIEGPVTLAALTGLRRGELLALRWRNVNLEEGWIFVAESLEQTKDHGVRFKSPKSRSARRRIPASTAVVEFLKNHRTRQQEHKGRVGLSYVDHDLVFSNEDGSPWPPDTLSGQFRGLANMVGLRSYRFHDLRHAFATLTLGNGTPLKEVTELMGHSTPTLTLATYTHAIAGLGREAVQGLERILLQSQEAVVG